MDVVDVLRDYIPMKAAGVNFRARCPFHHEKTPSFMVSPEKQIWHCFGCGKGGDVISFVMEIEGISFVEALKILAPRAGVKFREENQAQKSVRNRLLDIMDLSSRYYHKILTDHGAAKKAREYLEKRGLTSDTIEYWRIGYSPDSWDDLINFLKSKGFKENEIYLAGMSIKKEGTNRYYNRFRDRIVFPIRDINGMIVAFTARVNPEKEATEPMGKYINSPQTMIYDKSKIVFGLDKARLAIKNSDLAVMVEGQMDVITAHQNTYTNIVASSGTALTSEQVKLLKRYSNNIALAFDMDNAGEMALERGMREAMREEMNISIIRLPNGKDPDECIKNNPKEWEESVKSARPMMEYMFEKTFKDLDLRQVANKQKATKALLSFVVKLGNRIEQDFWLKRLAQIIDVNEDILREAISKKGKEKQMTPNNKMEQTNAVPATREVKISEMLLAILLRFPEIIEYCEHRIQPEQLEGQLNQTLYKNLTVYYNIITDKTSFSGEKAKEFYQGFAAWLESQDFSIVFAANSAKEIQDMLRRLAMQGDKDLYDHDLEKAKQEVLSLITTLKKKYLSTRMKEIQKTIAEAEKEQNENELGILMEEFKLLSDEMISYRDSE